MFVWMDTFELAGGATSQGGVTRDASLHVNTSDGTDDGDEDYSLRTDQSGVNGLTVFNNTQGSFMWAAQDIGGIDSHNAGVPTNIDIIDWAAIDITGQTDLSFSGLFGAANSLELFEANDFISVEVQIDGGGYVEILRFESDETSGANGFLRQDTDGDGIGDGQLLSFDLIEFGNFEIAGEGASLDLRLSFHVDGPNEQIGFDDFSINSMAPNIASVLADIEMDDMIYQESGGPQIISSTITVSDVDDVNIQSAAVILTGGLDSDNDVLGFVSGLDTGNITASYQSIIGALTLTGTATVAQYQAALRSVTYHNAFMTESTASRTFVFTVTDDTLTSNAVTRNSTFTLDETLDGDDDANTIAGGFGVDTIYGRAGNDRLFGQDDDDNLFGDSGNDQLWGMSGADAMDGGTGTDGVFYLYAASGVAFNAETGGTGGEAAGDTFANIEYFHGSNFNDTMDGGLSNDVFYGRNGDDIMNGGGGNDRLIGQNGADTLNGEGGNDRLYGGNGNDTLNGGDGNDTIAGNADNDIISGGEGIDRLFGGEGDDTLNGDEGNDWLFGGEGTNIVNGGDGIDYIFVEGGTDTIDGGAGTDRVLYSLADAGVRVALAVGGLGGEAAGDTYISIENLYGSHFDDYLEGDDFANIISGLNGIDNLIGNGGNDRLYGGNGTDQLDGGRGNDVLHGGAGNDIFHIKINDFGNDIISDWVDGEDMIQFTRISGVTTFADLTLSQIGSHVLIETNSALSTGTLIVRNANLADFSAADFNISSRRNEPLDDNKDVYQDDVVLALEDETPFASEAEIVADYHDGMQTFEPDFDAYL